MTYYVNFGISVFLIVVGIGKYVEYHLDSVSLSSPKVIEVIIPSNINGSY